MSVTRFEKIRQTRIEHDQVRNVVEVTETYIAHLDNPREPRRQLMLYRPDLARYQPHPDEPTARAISFEVNQRTHSLIYDVVVRWSSDLTIPTNPLDEPARITIETVTESVPFTHDHEGQPNVNTAGDLLEGAEDDALLLVFRITKKIDPNYPAWLLTYGQAINSDTVVFKGRPLRPKTLKVGKISIGEEQEEEDVPFVPLSMELLYSRDTWEQEFLNRGTRELTILRRPTGNGQYEFVTAKLPILDDTQKPVTEPQFLDEEGRRPRVDGSGRRMTLQQELDLLNQQTSQFFGIREFSRLKYPLDPEDIITLKRTRRQPRPFNGVLPLT